METKVQENKVRQMEFPFWKAPLPGFHYSHPGPLASEGLWLLWRADWKGAWIVLPWAPPGLLGALGTASAPGDLRPQSPHLYSIVWAVFPAQVRGRNGHLGLCVGVPGQSVWEVRAVRWDDRGGGREQRSGRERPSGPAPGSATDDEP